jgi:hypothetical protein
MPKNFFKRLKESMIPSRGNQEDKSLDFERAKEILFSSETPQQLISAVKYINNFNKKYGIGKNSPEFKYFERMILVMKLKIRSKEFDFGEDLSEGERMNRNLRDIIKESLGDFDWIKDIEPTPPREWGEVRVGDVLYIGDKYAPRYLLEIIRIAAGWVDYELLLVPDDADEEEEYVGAIRSVSEFKAKDLITDALFWQYYSIVEGGEPPSGPSLNESNELDWIKDSQSEFDPNFEFYDMEYWVDISGLNRKEKKIVLDYIKSRINIKNSYHYGLSVGRLHRYSGIIVHCGEEDNNYEAKEGVMCFMSIPFDEDENNDNSIYVDGREVLIWVKSNNNEEEEELEESLEWTDKDTSYETDKSFESDPTWTGDDEWASNPERSYWKQGDAGGGGDTGGDMNESEEDPFKWVKDVEPDDIIASGVNLFSDEDMYNILDEMGFLAYSDDEMSELAINLGYRWSEKHDGWYDPAEITPPRFY